MTNVTTVKNVKPNVKTISNVKPLNSAINVYSKNFTYLESRTINKGQPVGLLLSLTYPITFTFQATRL